MQQAKSLHALTAVEVLVLSYNDDTTIEEYARAPLGRIESRDHIVNAWEYMGALLALLASDQEYPG
jgi:hypothetical protein